MQQKNWHGNGFFYCLFINHCTRNRRKKTLSHLHERHVQRGIKYAVQKARLFKRNNWGQIIGVRVKLSDQFKLNFTLTPITTNDTLISATIADNELTIHCLPNQHGRAVLSILAESNGLTIVDQMIIVVNPVDDPPEVASLISDIHVDEDADKSIIDLTNAFDDIDNEDILHGIQTNSNPSLVHTIINNESLTLTYVADQNGYAVIVISGLSNGKTVTQAFNVYVTPINDAPVAYDSHIYVMEDTPISAKIQVSDVDLDLLTINLESLPQHGVLTLSDQKFGHFIYTPHDDYEGMDLFSFTVSDNLLSSQMAYVNISITPVNDDPTISKVLDQKTFESTPISQISMNISDPDSKRLTITALSDDTQLLPLELIRLSIGQSVHTHQISIAAESFENPVFLDIEPAPGEAGKAKVILSIRDDRGAVMYQRFSVFVEKHTITAFSSGNGTIEPCGVIEVNTGEPFVFKIIPDDGYVIDQLNVDGTILSPRPTYIFWDVNESHEITSVFREPYMYTDNPCWNRWKNRTRWKCFDSGWQLSNISYSAFPRL